MPRRIDDIPVGENNWPEPGWHYARCTKVMEYQAKKGTDGLKTFWVTEKPQAGFTIVDTLYITPRAIGRLAVVARKVIGFDGEVSDDDKAAVLELAEIIEANIVGRRAEVQVVIEETPFMHQSGPDVGKTSIRRQHKVAFAGYRQPEDEQVPPPSKTKKKTQEAPVESGGRDEDLPF